MLLNMSDAVKKDDNSSISATPVRDEEAQLDAPDRGTLFMLSAICIATVIMWAAGRAACNYRVKGESLQPRSVSLVERTKTAQATAFEWAQAFSSGRFESLDEISALSFKPALIEMKNACTNCNALAPQSVARVLSEDEKVARVSVKTWIGQDVSERLFSLKVNDAGRWQVLSVQ